MTDSDTDTDTDTDTDRAGDFRSLVGAQFLGAFNDNLFKQLLLFLAGLYLFPGEDKQGLAFAIFALPFVLFSGMAGDLSERFSKRSVIVWMKVLEIAVMGLGVVGFWVGSWPFLLAVLFLMGLQSAFFGPSKYGVIPELVPRGELLAANGTIAATTFMAVLLGQALAGPLLDRFADRLWAPGLVCMGVALAGTGFARRMKPLLPQKPELTIKPNPFGRLWATISTLRERSGLFRIVLLYSFFWFNGGVLQQSITGLAEPLGVVQGETTKLSYLMITLALSIMAGSVLAPRIGRILAPCCLTFFGAAGMLAGQWGLCGIETLDDFGSRYIMAHCCLGVVGLVGASFVVALQTYLQDAPPPGMRGQTFAVNNFMNFLFIFFGGVFYMIAREHMGLGAAATQAIAGGVLLLYLFANRTHVKAMSIGIGDTR